MSTDEPNRDLNRMRHLAQQNVHNARDMDRLYPVGSPEDAASEFAHNQAEINQLMVETFTVIDGRMETMADDVREIKADLETVKTKQQTMVQDIARIERRQNTMSNDIAQVKGGHARVEVAQEAGVIALDMGLEYVRNVEKLELARWAQENSNSGIDSSELRSFREADLVVEARDGSDTIYIAVEISFTADRRDTDRAQRNANFLQMFTGHPAQAAIASVKNDDSATEQIDNGLVHWHSIERRSLEPD